jgi:hypothetical protein
MPVDPELKKKVEEQFERELDRYMKEWVRVLRSAGPNTTDEDEESESEHREENQAPQNSSQ